MLIWSDSFFIGYNKITCPQMTDPFIHCYYTIQSYFATIIDARNNYLQY